MFFSFVFHIQICASVFWPVQTPSLPRESINTLLLWASLCLNSPANSDCGNRGISMGCYWGQANSNKERLRWLQVPSKALTGWERRVRVLGASLYGWVLELRWYWRQAILWSSQLVRSQWDFNSPVDLDPPEPLIYSRCWRQCYHLPYLAWRAWMKSK